MVELYGRKLSRREISAHAGALAQFAGVRLMTLSDGVERGVRMLEFRTGTGLRFTALVDRALDIADCEYKGMAVGWNSPAGFRHPGLHEYEGEGGLAWLRSFSGLLVTCGLDHILFMYDEPATITLRARKSVIHRSMAASSRFPRADRLANAGMRPSAFSGGRVWQQRSLVEDALIRRIEAKVGTTRFSARRSSITASTRLTLLHHINIGHPVLAEGSRYLAPIADVVWAAHAGESYRKQGIGYGTMPAPQLNFHEQVWQHELKAAADGEVPVALVNDALGIGFEVVTRKDQFPCQFEWQNLQSGQYALGIEPSTNHVLGHKGARERGELIWLEHGEAREYQSTFRILDGASASPAE